MGQPTNEQKSDLNHKYSLLFQALEEAELMMNESHLDTQAVLNEFIQAQEHLNDIIQRLEDIND